MINYFKPSLDIFGLDISDFSLKAAKIRGSRLHSFASVPLKPGVVVKGKIEKEPEFISALAVLTKKMRPETKYVSVALPEERSFIKVIRMPKMDKRDLEGAIAYEAKNHFPVPIEEVYLDFNVIEPIEEGDYMEILLAALPCDVADSCVSALSSAGFFTASIEIESLAIVRSLIDVNKSQDPLLIIDIGEERTSFTIFSGGTIRFTGSILISSELINLESGGLAESREENESAINELARAIRRHLDYYRSRMAHKEGFDNVSNVILCGGAAGVEGLSERLSSMTNSKVIIADPFINLSTRPKKLSLEEGLRYGVAIGAAMKKLTR